MTKASALCLDVDGHGWELVSYWSLNTSQCQFKETRACIKLVLLHHFESCHSVYRAAQDQIVSQSIFTISQTAITQSHRMWHNIQVCELAKFMQCDCGRKKCRCGFMLISQTVLRVGTVHSIAMLVP